MYRFAPDAYELLDFGAGRRLERLGRYTLDRPCPAAASIARRDPRAWAAADARYERSAGERGRWSRRGAIAEPWQVRCGGLAFELKLTPFGHVGLFPEQAEHWDWIAEQARLADRPLKVLNLFAHTGGSTLVSAAAGCSVVHMDSAANVVAWARRNAEASSLSQAPVRWITEDAVKFARRELKRGQRYDAIILDPPTYGHGPHAEVWKIDEHLDHLWTIALELLSENWQFVLLTCHSADFPLATLQQRYTIGRPSCREVTASAGDVHLVSRAGARLDCGTALRWSARTTEKRIVTAHCETRRLARHGDQDHQQSG